MDVTDPHEAKKVETKEIIINFIKFLEDIMTKSEKNNEIDHDKNIFAKFISFIFGKLKLIDQKASFKFTTKLIFNIFSLENPYISEIISRLQDNNKIKFMLKNYKYYKKIDFADLNHLKNYTLKVLGNFDENYGKMKT